MVFPLENNLVHAFRVRLFHGRNCASSSFSCFFLSDIPSISCIYSSNYTKAIINSSIKLRKWRNLCQNREKECRMRRLRWLKIVFRLLNTIMYATDRQNFGTKGVTFSLAISKQVKYRPSMSKKKDNLTAPNVH